MDAVAATEKWRHVAKFLKLGVTLQPLYLENGKSYEKVTANANIPGPSTVMFRFTVGPKAKVAAPPKTPTNKAFLGK